MRSNTLLLLSFFYLMVSFSVVFFFCSTMWFQRFSLYSNKSNLINQWVKWQKINGQHLGLLISKLHYIYWFSMFYIILSFFILLPCALWKCNVVSWHFRDKMANLLIIINPTYWLILKITVGCSPSLKKASFCRGVEPYSGHNWGSYELGQPNKCTCHQLSVSNQQDWVKTVLSCVRQSFNVVVLKITFFWLIEWRKHATRISLMFYHKGKAKQ